MKSACTTFVLLALIDYLVTPIHSYFTIESGATAQFLSTCSQILATLLGFLVAFYIFRAQWVDQKKDAEYRRYREAMIRLINLAREAPIELDEVTEGLSQVTDEFGFRRLDDLPEFRHEADDIHPLQLSSMQFRDPAVACHHNVSSENRLYLQQILLAFHDVEDAMNSLVVQYIGIVVMSNVLGSIRTLSTMLGLSITLMLAYSITDVLRIMPQLSAPIIGTFLMLLILAIADLVLQTMSIYGDLHGSWNFPENIWDF